MHWKRWITALVAIPPLILLIFKANPVVFMVAIMVISILALREYFCIIYHNLNVPLIYQGWAYICGALVVAAVHFELFPALMIILALNLIGTALLSIFRFRSNMDAPVVAIKQVFGVIYIPLFLSFLIMLRAAPDGPLWVFLLLWVVAWGDTGALYVGTYWGRHKLCPAVSPKKTIEGALGGLAANLAFGWLLKLLFFSDLPGLTFTFLLLSVGAVGQVGDLFESEFKRAAGVKDSSNLLPGHGGILDRIDALLFATPLAYLLKVYLLP